MYMTSVAHIHASAVTWLLPSVCGYGLCAASATPSIVQRYLTALSFMPSHSLTGGHLGLRPPLTAVICYLNRANMELVQGLEPRTHRLQNGCSTIRATPANGADAETRTLNPLLTKQLLYHWSYVIMAGAERFELSPKVLETFMLPLHQTPIWRPRRVLIPLPPA